MNIKSIPLGASAAALAATGAQAADLPVAPEPVDYVRVCDAFGTGFFYIPGTETCLKIGGGVRAEFRMFDVLDNGGSAWDARTDTSTGLKCTLEQGGKVVGSPTASNVTTLSWVYVW